MDFTARRVVLSEMVTYVSSKSISSSRLKEGLEELGHDKCLFIQEYRVVSKQFQLSY